jgi:hypothetical protein
MEVDLMDGSSTQLEVKRRNASKKSDHSLIKSEEYIIFKLYPLNFKQG